METADNPNENGAEELFSTGNGQSVIVIQSIQIYISSQEYSSISGYRNKRRIKRGQKVVMIV